MPRLMRNVAAEIAASLAEVAPRVGSDGDMAIILSAEDGDESDHYEAHEADSFDADGCPNQPRTYFLMVSHHGHGTYRAEAKGYGEGHGEDGCEPGQADRTALAFRGWRRRVHGTLLTAACW